jgi:fumarate hydratase, class I
MNAPTAIPTPKPVPPYKHTPLFPLGADTTPYKKITTDGVRVEKVLGKDMLVVSREALRALSEAAFGDINHYLRPGHLKQLRSILDDKEASDNDKFVAFDFLKNANIAAGGILPMCQDTGTAIIMGKKGSRVLTDGDDEAALSEGARDAYLRRNLRYSQVAPLSMYEEKNTANNMPAQCEIYAEGDDTYKFMFMAKGGGSANKSFLFQATPSVLTRDRMLAFLKEKVLTLGTAACPPYHLAIVIGGTSAELCMKTVKLASNLGTFILYALICGLTIVAFSGKVDFSFFKHSMIPILGLIGNIILVLTIFIVGIITGGTTAEATYLALGIAGVWLVVSVLYLVITSSQKQQAILPAPHEMLAKE